MAGVSNSILCSEYTELIESSFVDGEEYFAEVINLLNDGESVKNANCFVVSEGKH